MIVDIQTADICHEIGAFDSVHGRGAQVCVGGDDLDSECTVRPAILPVVCDSIPILQFGKRSGVRLRYTANEGRRQNVADSGSTCRAIIVSAKCRACWRLSRLKGVKTGDERSE